MNRRTFFKTSVLGTVALSQSCAAPGKRQQAINPVAAPFDREMEAFMSARKIPGGTLAVVRNRRLVYAKGYGWANREKNVPATPESLFRIASISKPVTAVAILKLVEEGRLDLDAKALGFVDHLTVGSVGATFDPRLASITVRQLLQHTGGWDRDMSFDPMFRPRAIAKVTGSPAPAGAEAVIRYMLAQPLDFNPGARYAYSNFGYCILGRVIEKVSGQPYDRHVRENILKRCGIRTMRLGASLDGKAAANEVRYFMPDEGRADSVFPDVPGRVPFPYGGFHLEAMDAHGGWIASAIDLARFAAALDDPKSSPVLKPSSFATMYAPPRPPASRKSDGSLEASYYGCGWMVRPVGNGNRANYWHSGSLPGTSTLLVRRHDGLSWAVLFNQRSNDRNLPDNAIDPALHRAAAAVKEWPRHNLFDTFPGPA